MLNRVFSIITIIIIIIGSVCCDVNYCTATKCGKDHIACNNSGEFGQSCPTDRADIKMTADLKAAILKKHNTARMNVANGKVNGKDFTYDPANRMIQMTWDDELSYIALLNAKTCRFDHDKCRNTVTFPNVGQNIAAGSVSEKSDVISDINRFIDLWYNQYINCNMREIRKLSGLSNENGEYGHFTQMVTAKATKIGCGMTHYSNRALFVCNYSFGNLLDSAVYVSGQPCSECKTGCSKKYPGLCTSKEKPL